jgi:aminopeptidase N
MKKVLLTTILGLGSLYSLAQQFNHYIFDADASPREHQLDIEHMKLDVRFDPRNGKVSGTVVHTFNALRKSVDTVFWDAPAIDIVLAKIKVDGVSNMLKWKTTKKGVVTYFDVPLTWDKKYEIEFTYTAYPKKGIYFVGWDKLIIPDRKHQTRQQIWTQGQGIDNRHWIPMYDNMNDKFVTETIITFQKDFNVLSNGDLLSEKENDDQTKTWHYKLNHPHAGYLLMLAIDKYAVKRTTTSRNTPVQFWYYPEHEKNVPYASMHTERIIEFLEDETGFPYPWGTYSQVMVQEFIYGAMENTSATVFGDFFNVDEFAFNDRNYIGVNAHELTHQWFGDLITARNRTGTWLQESFATYYAKLFKKSLHGEDEFRWVMRGEINRALGASLQNNYPICHTKAGSARVYQKGSSVIQMMRYVLGDDAFKRVIKHYLETYAYGNVETNDINLAIQDVLGKPMDWFFDQWLYRGGEPHYSIEIENKPGWVYMNVEQIQQIGLTISTFKMPVNCGIYFTDGSMMEKTVWIEDSQEQISFEVGEGKTLSYALFDINSEILKKATFKKPLEMLLHQLKKANHMIDRYDALLALQDTGINKKREALLDALKKETHWAIKAEIVKQLSDDEECADELTKQLKDADVRVRRSLLNTSDDVVLYKEVFSTALADKSYLNIGTALNKLIENDAQNAHTYLGRTDGLLGMAHGLRITWLGHKLIQLRTDSASLMRDRSSSYYMYMDELTLYSSSMYEFRTRINAMQAIRKFNFLSAPAIENMFEACMSKNRRLAGPAKNILMWYHDQYELKKAIQQVFENVDYTNEEKKKLRDLGVVK